MLLMHHIFLFVLVLAPNQTTTYITEIRKQEFIDLLQTLPHKGEFFTDDAIAKAGPYLPTLFALTEADLAEYDIYPFGALSRGLSSHLEHRKYALRNFSKIQHPTIKLLWAVLLFDSAQRSPEIVRFLKDALEDPAQTKILSEGLGPKFSSFKNRVLSRSTGP